VLTVLTDDVAWANGMDGGYVHGREAVRQYWTRQRSMVSPHVEPVGFHRIADGAIIAEVRQSIRDLEGKPLQGQARSAAYLVPITIESGPTRCLSRVFEKPASRIQARHSAPV
jgi:hypothetical protein